MGILNADENTDPSGEEALRDGGLESADQRRKRNPDRVVRVDGEKDTLYKDGLDVDDDDSPPMGTSSSP